MKTDTKPETKRERMLRRITQHGQTLLAIFPEAKERDPHVLCSKLRRIEAEANRYALRLCNGPEFESEAAADEAGEAILAKVDRLLGYSAAGVPVVLNCDPRGYALKIRSEWTAEHAPRLHRDWGGYGLLAPDLSND